MADGNITTYAALTAGLLSFLSPCVLPLVPAYVAYLAGASLRDIPDVMSNSREQGWGRGPTRLSQSGSPPSGGY